MLTRAGAPLCWAGYSAAAWHRPAANSWGAHRSRWLASTRRRWLYWALWQVSPRRHRPPRRTCVSTQGAVKRIGVSRLASLNRSYTDGGLVGGMRAAGRGAEPTSTGGTVINIQGNADKALLIMRS